VNKSVQNVLKMIPLGCVSVVKMVLVCELQEPELHTSTSADVTAASTPTATSEG
jgi:hypothetical protein